MNRIYITQRLSADLKSRSTVHTLFISMQSENMENVIFDFSNVNFATRSFLDEFYNVFIKKYNAKVENVPSEIALILDTVSKTQEKKKSLPQQNNVKSFRNVDDFCTYMSSLAF